MNFRIFLLILGFLPQAHSAWILKQTRMGKSTSPIAVSYIADSTTVFPKVIKSLPRFLKEKDKSSEELYEEILWPDDELPASFSHLARSVKNDELADHELRVITEQGPAENRICLTFVGDGYTLSEKEKFYSDVARMVDDLFKGNTFKSYRSLFNVYAVFVPSKESGITDLKRKDTVFGLYREPAGSKRAIMPGNTRALDEALAKAPKTDYPIVIANDKYYGGLGGQYAITTSSAESGKIVLRHELGHNFGGVGEEYDGGSVYTGANSTTSPNAESWKHWLKRDQKVHNDMRFLGGAYVWQNLEQKSVVQKFNFPAPNNKGPFWFSIELSSVGWESLDDIEVLVDGEKQTILGRGTSDRSFFRTERINTLQPGPHTLEVREVRHDGNNILAFADLYAYEADYDFEGGVGAFTTYNSWGGKSYRPTHAHCIMRDMLHEHFCSIDQENMWFQFFNRVNLIDEVKVTDTQVVVTALPMTGVTISWFKGNTEIPELKNSFTAQKEILGKGNFSVKLKFETPEIRKNPESFAQEKRFSIP